MEMIDMPVYEADSLIRAKVDGNEYLLLVKEFTSTRAFAEVSGESGHGPATLLEGKTLSFDIGQETIMGTMWDTAKVIRCFTRKAKFASQQKNYLELECTS